MLVLPMLDVAIGVIFTYLLLSLVCTSVNEMIAGFSKRRAKFLDEGILQILGTKTLKDAFYQHPLITSLAPKREKEADKVRTGVESVEQVCPSYIPADAFAIAIRDLCSGTAPSTDLSAIRENIHAFGSKTFQNALRLLLNEAGNDVVTFDASLRTLFNHTMDRVSGLYKRNSQKWVLALAFAVTIFVNADTLRIIRILSKDPGLRQAFVAASQHRLVEQRPVNDLPMAVYTDDEKPEEGRPIEVSLKQSERNLLASITGWDEDFARFNTAMQQRKITAISTKGVTSDHQSLDDVQLSSTDLWGVSSDWAANVLKAHILGWLLTAFALSLGAPFWFDVLNRVMNIRNAGRKPDAHIEAKEVK
jgi:hypothetical protein